MGNSHFADDNLQLRFHSVSQSLQSLRRIGRGFVGNNAHQVRAFAESDALRIGNASIAQLDGFGIAGLAGFQNLASARRVAHGVYIHHSFHLALVLIVGG